MQLALAPLLLGCEQAFYCAELGERVVSKQSYICSIERHFPSPGFVLAPDLAYASAL
jgi:hypothetical protein